MRVRRLSSIVASIALAAPLLGVTAPIAVAASPLTITADMPSAVPTGHNWGFNDFFPRALSVPQGATIQFSIQGFHTATLLPAGMTGREDERTNGVARTDPDDTARNINGTSHSQFNLAGLSPAPGGCGTTLAPCTFAGTSVVSSGVLFGPPTGPFVVHVTASPGTYVFNCRVHPRMTGQLKVLPAGAQGTSPASLKDKVEDQVEAAIHAGFVAEERAENASVIHHADGTRTWILTAGTGSPDGRVAVNEFLPLHVWIRPGDQVMWKPRAINEPHTVTFPGELFTDLVPLCESGTTDTPAAPRVTPPTSPLDFTCGASPLEIEFGGGNGVRHVTSPAAVSDSGLLAPRVLSRALGLPRSATLTSWKVSFAGAAKGTYTLVCQIHQGMAETITVH